MRRTGPKVGQTGMVLVGTGLALAIIAIVMSFQQPFMAVLLVAVACAVYLPGGFMLISHFDYKRGTTPFIAMTFSRLVIATSVMLVMLNGFAAAGPSVPPASAPMQGPTSPSPQSQSNP